MSSNDGQRMVVFGLSFREHHTLHMQQVLRSYGRLPANPNDRGALYAGLFILSQHLGAEEGSGIENWLRNGGAFPTPEVTRDAIGHDPFDGNDSDVVDEWPDYHSEDFASGDEEGGMDDGSNPDEEMDDEVSGDEHHDGESEEAKVIVRDVTSGADNDEQESEIDEASHIPLPPLPSPAVARTSQVDPLPAEARSEIKFADSRVLNGRRVGEEEEQGADIHTQDYWTWDEESSSWVRRDTTLWLESRRLTRREVQDYYGDLTDDEYSENGRPLNLRNPWADDELATPQLSDDGLFQKSGTVDNDRPADGKRIDCYICCENYDREDCPSPVTPNCKHSSQEVVCIYCLQRLIQASVSEGELARIRCPICEQNLEPEEIKAYATAEVFARYEYLMDRANPDHILCMSATCDQGQVHAGASPMMVCNTCSFKTCAVHKLPWHEGFTCEEFDMQDSQIERLEQAEATAKLLAKEQAQVCSNCGQGVSRIDGCDHMTCRCGTEWCYLCGALFDNVKRLGDAAHAPTCMYHPQRVNARRDAEQVAQGQLAELIHGGVTDTLARARDARNQRIRAEMRPHLAEAAERRAKEAKEAKEARQREKEEESGGFEKKRKIYLDAAWEEK